MGLRVVGPRQIEEGVAEIEGAETVDGCWWDGRSIDGRQHVGQRGSLSPTWNNKLVEVDHEQVATVEHVPVETVVERGENAFGADLFL